MKCFLCLLSVLFSIQAFSQHPVLLAKGNAQLESPSQTWDSHRRRPDAVFEHAAYLLIQFDELPGKLEKSELADRGIHLLRYIPNATWLARIDVGLSAADLENAGVAAMGMLSPTSKMPSAMADGEIPRHAGNHDAVLAKVLFWERGNDMGKMCVEAGLEVLGVDEKWSAVEVRGKWQQVRQFAAHPLVQFIEWPEPPMEYEVLNERTLIQSNYISDNPALGLHYNGSSVTIAVNEGGTVNPVEEPNLEGRLDRSLETGNPSGHKTGVGLRMASAGNIDPDTRGTAFGATLQSGGINFANAAAAGVSIVNNSFGYGCISGSVTYNSGAANNDNLVRTNPGFMVTYSAGNMGGSDCGYGAGAGWANITGLVKSAKNIFAVGSLGTNGALTGFSSRGPAWDGRILPDICATGPGGTSHASPNLAGTYGQLLHAFREFNGFTPPSGLLKAIILNTADEVENPGPDFKSGFGKLNARRAFEVIRLGQHLTDSVVHGGSNSHSLTVPANVKELKVILYWTDYEATAGIVSRALVNDLDASLQDPAMAQWQPWVLDPTPNAVTLNQNAVRGLDTLNNVEQITLANPAAGAYTFTVNGSMVPQGPQTYFVVYEYVYDEVVVSYPAGGDHFLPNTTERIRWESLGDTGAFDLDYSADGGGNWTSVASGLPASDRYYDWNVPDTVSKDALIRVSRASVSDVSDTSFHILGRPQNLELAWSCSDSSMIVWDSMPPVDGYIIYRLGINYMDSVGYTSDNRFVLHNFSPTRSEYLAVSSVQNGAVSRRTIAIERPPQDSNCVLDDLSMAEINSPGTSYLPSCISPALTVTLKNIGVNPITNIPVAYRIDGGAVVVDTLSATVASASSLQATLNPTLNLGVGAHLIEAWVELAGDPNPNNDTLMDSVTVYSSSAISLAYTQNFDAFSTCNTAWGCESITCNLSQGWYNLPNVPGGDDIDWRTHTGATGSGSTGPSNDHTTGSGNYLYLEGSGNGGSGCQNSEARLFSPCIDLTGLTQAQLSFWYHAFGNSIGSLHIDVIADGQLNEDIAAPIVGAQGNQWIQASADLSAFAGKVIVIVFRGYTGNGFLSDLAIDDIFISAPPAPAFSATDTLLCLNQNTQFLNTSVSANSYEWQISPSTFAYQNSTNSSSAQPEVSFSSPGFYTVQLTATNNFGSDSTVQVNFIEVVAPPVPLLVDDADTTYCDGDSVVLRTNAGGGLFTWYRNGAFLYTGPDTVYTYTNVSDQDVLHVSRAVNASCTILSNSITISVLSPSFSNISANACESYTSPSGQFTWTTSGTYSDTLVGIAGCDSILDIQLTVDSIDPGVSQVGSTLTALQSGATYQWVDCNANFTAISGATAQSFSPVASGNYACILAVGACTDTSACTPVTIIGLSASLSESVTIYPNPTSSALHVECASRILRVRVLDVLGKELLEAEDKVIVVRNLAVGVYFLEVKTDRGLVYKRFVKE